MLSFKSKPLLIRETKILLKEMPPSKVYPLPVRWHGTSTQRPRSRRLCLKSRRQFSLQPPTYDKAVYVTSNYSDITVYVCNLISFGCLSEETLNPWLSRNHPVKTVRLHGCTS